MDPNLKQRIIDEAYVLFLTKGMKQTSFCDVAAAVHKSKGAVMHYFSSKRHLIDTVVKMRFFPASQLSPEMDYLEGRRWDEFLRSYKNPIERVIDSFPEKLEGQRIDVLHAVRILRQRIHGRISANVSRTSYQGTGFSF